jgi:hypothetical protein
MTNDFSPAALRCTSWNFPAPHLPCLPRLSCNQVYKGAAHPHEAQQPVAITSEIDKRASKLAGAALLAAKKAELAGKQ